MQLITYASPLAKNVIALKKKADFIDDALQHLHFSSIEDLGEHLRHPLGQSISILMPANQDELDALIQIRYLFRDTRIILVLPDQQDQSIPPCRAHMLRPRFVSYAKDSWSEVLAVLNKMMATTSSEATI